jgi:LPS export ABC transporter permease LptG/LPS export ABC transporter permease LptF
MTLRSLRPTLVDRYIFREILPFAGVGLVLFTFVLMLPQIAELMGMLVSHNADPLTILRIFWYWLPHNLALTIPMSVLLGVLLAFGRMGSESEVIALRAGGVGPGRLVRPVMAIALLATLATLYITAIAYPRANEEFRALTASLVASKMRTAVKPRVFTDDLLPSATLMLYVSDVASGTGDWRNVLIRDKRDPQKPRLVLARQARLEIERAREEARLDLTDGAVFALDPTQPKRWEEQRFASREMLLPFEELFPPKIQLVKGRREMTVFEVQDAIRAAEKAGTRPEHIAPLRVEWHFRFAVAGACLVFGLLGIGLSLGQKKEARSAAFGLSVAAIFVYYVFLRFGQQFGENGWVHPALAMWSANLVFGGAALGLLYLNHREAAFDPLDLELYRAWLPRMRRHTPTVASAAAHEEPDSDDDDTTLPTRRRIRLGSLLDGYICRSYLGHLGLAAVAFLSLTMLLEFMDLVDDIQQNKVAWSTLFHYLLFEAPDRLQLVLLVTFLVATLTTLGIMARRNEITAMKAGGISVYRVALPITAMALAGSLLIFGLGEFFVPYTNRVARRDHDIIKGRPTQSVRQMEQRMLLGHEGRFYEVTGSRATPEVLYTLWVFGIDPQSWRLEECIFASQARWNHYGGYWDLERGWRRTLGASSAGAVFHPFDAAKSRDVEPPKFFGQERGSGDTLSFTELNAHISSLAAQGMDVVSLQVDLHSKLALPAVAVVMALIGIPFSFVVGRRGALYGVGIALLLAIVYWSCFEIFRALGVNGLLAPALAMWAPNILFAGAAVYLLLSLDT